MYITLNVFLCPLSRIYQTVDYFYLVLWRVRYVPGANEGAQLLGVESKYINSYCI